MLVREYYVSSDGIVLPSFNITEQGKALPFPNTLGGPTGSHAFRVWLLITDAGDWAPCQPAILRKTTSV